MIAISILYHSKVLLASLWIWTKNENSRSVFREIQNGHLHGILPVNSVALMPLECFDSRIRIGCNSVWVERQYLSDAFRFTHPHRMYLFVQVMFRAIYSHISFRFSVPLCTAIHKFVPIHFVWAIVFVFSIRASQLRCAQRATKRRAPFSIHASQLRCNI